MSERRKIVTDHARADELPERFRAGVDPQADIEVTVRVLASPDMEKPSSEAAERPKYLKYWGAAAHLGTTTQEAVERIRALRDEWD